MELLHLLTITIEPEPPLALGAFPTGERRLVTFRSGTFTGRDGLAGSLAAGGVDWQVVRPDGTVDIAAHYLLVTDDGEPIEVRSDGLRSAAPEVAARLAAGEIVDPSDYYFRTHIRLATSAPRWDRLNSIIAVARGERHPGQVRIHVYEVT